ncbi:hypothetical protein GGR58DRAFT_44705 [Xylaria digitata]|nr:hypothetical protein GGR58DRAFT_44705 [Xylaria digitata]
MQIMWHEMIVDPIRTSRSLNRGHIPPSVTKCPPALVSLLCPLSSPDDEIPTLHGVNTRETRLRGISNPRKARLYNFGVYMTITASLLLALQIYSSRGENHALRWVVGGIAGLLSLLLSMVPG